MIVPHQYATLRHPQSVCLGKADLLSCLDGWITELFDPGNLHVNWAQLASFTNQVSEPHNFS